LDLRVQVHPGEIWVSKQRVHIVLEASKLAGAKGDSEKFLKFLFSKNLRTLLGFFKAEKNSDQKNLAL
jgi:hypothetical protein